MSNDITKVLEAEVKRIASEIQALEAKIATLKGQQSVLNNTVDFYRGGAKKSAESAKAPVAKRGPKAAATGKQRGRPKKEVKAAAPAAPAAVAAAPVAPAPVAAAPAAEKKKPGRKPATKAAAPAAVAAPAPVAPKPVKEAKAPAAPKAAADSKKAAPKKPEAPAKPAAKPVEKPAAKPVEKPAAKPAEKPAEKPAVKEAPKAAVKAAPKTAKASAEKPAAKNKGGIAERTAPKVETPAAKPAAKPAEKPSTVAKPTVSKKADKAPRGPKPGVSKAERGESLTSKVLELFKAKGELEPIDVAKGTGVGQDKFNSVRSTINILYLKGTLARRKKDGKTNTYSYAFPEHYAKAGIQYEMGNKGGK